MDDWSVDVAILSSQKALALPPGLSFVAFSQTAKKRLDLIKPKSLYFDLNNYLENQKRGQMPYTPAISLFTMLHQRLKDINELGIDSLISEQNSLAVYFRSKISDMPLRVLPQSPSNALTALWCDDGIDAFEIVRILKEKYNTFLASNGGDLRHKVFRISHMGDQTKIDIDFLVENIRAIIFQMSTQKERRLNL